MASHTPGPGNLRLRYAAADVFTRADTGARVLARLAPEDPFTVLGTEGEYYQVRLPDGVVGFIYAHNVVGTDMPLTVTEQRTADERAAQAARPPQGWQGLLHRLRETRR
jgi:hypothetical protein